MRDNYIGLFWKYTGVLSGLAFVIVLVATIWSVKSTRSRIWNEAKIHVQEINGIVSRTLTGETITQALQFSDRKNEHYLWIENQVRQIFQFANTTNPDYAISRIRVITPDSVGFRLFFSTQTPFRYMASVPTLPAYQEVFRSHRFQTMDDYLEAGHHFLSAVAPLRTANGNVVGLVQSDMDIINIKALYPGYLGRFLGLLLPALFIVLVLSAIMSRMVTQPIHRYVSFIRTLPENGFTDRIDVRTGDELEQVGSMINVLLERLQRLSEKEAAQEELQEQITHLMETVSRAAEGDFTVSAEVTASALGALSDSFNLMVSDLSKIIRSVKEASDKISRSTREILLHTEVMAQGAGTQAKEIETTHQAAREMADLIKYANERTLQAAETARKAAQVAESGEAVVRESIQSMHRIRETVQETARRVRMLGESSTEIGEIIEVISDIANRTNLLALNATIEAARAGEAGRGFAVVADEVRMLAERSSQAAKDIAVLIESIQAGTSETVEAMEQGTRVVEEGTRLVDETGTALKNIREMVQNSSQLITEISGAFQQQTKASFDIANTMERIAQIANNTAEGARKSRALAEEMEKLSRELNNNISKFKLAKHQTQKS